MCTAATHVSSRVLLDMGMIAQAEKLSVFLPAVCSRPVLAQPDPWVQLHAAPAYAVLCPRGFKRVHGHMQT